MYIFSPKFVMRIITSICEFVRFSFVRCFERTTNRIILISEAAYVIGYYENICYI